MSSAGLASKPNRWSTDTPTERRGPTPSARPAIAPIRIPNKGAPTSRRPNNKRPKVYTSAKVVTSVNMAQDLKEAAHAFLVEHKVSFSHYVEALIEADMTARGLWPPDKT